MGADDFKWNQWADYKNNSKTDGSDSFGGEDPNDYFPNEGKIILDAICATRNILYPEDVCLVNEATSNLEIMIDYLHTSVGNR